MSYKVTAWICDNPEPIVAHAGLAGSPTLCRKCGGTPIALHPVAICTTCGHRVDFHGADTRGCGVRDPREVCLCEATFGRARALNAN